MHSTDVPRSKIKEVEKQNTALPHSDAIIFFCGTALDYAPNIIIWPTVRLCVLRLNNNLIKENLLFIWNWFGPTQRDFVKVTILSANHKPKWQFGTCVGMSAYVCKYICIYNMCFYKHKCTCLYFFSLPFKTFITSSFFLGTKYHSTQS